MTVSTSFPQHPRRGGDWWSVWQNLQDFANRVFDAFANGFAGGSATVANGNTTVAVTASLFSAYRVCLTPTVDPGARYWVSGKSSSGFTINLSAASVGGTTFDWTAKQA